MACCEKIVVLEVDIINGEKLPCKRKVAFSLKDFSVRGIEERNFFDMESGTLSTITAMYVMGYGIEYGIIDYEDVNNIFAGNPAYCVCLNGCGVLFNGQKIKLNIFVIPTPAYCVCLNGCSVLINEQTIAL